jgi:hypothetical protein
MGLLGSAGEQVGFELLCAPFVPFGAKKYDHSSNLLRAFPYEWRKIIACGKYQKRHVLWRIIVLI